MKKCLFFVGFFFLSYCLKAQTDTTFWFVAPDVVYPANAAANTEIPIFLRLTCQNAPATVTITQPANIGFTPIVVNLAANAVTSVDLTNFLSSIENQPANQVLNKGLLIKATNLITVYYEQASLFNPDIFALKGANALGTNFIVPTQTAWINNIVYQQPTPQNGFDIVATENNTSVTIKPTNAIVGHAANVAFTINLNKGQTYSAIAIGHLGSQHLAGTTVTATAPIAITTKDDFLNDPVYGTCSDLAGDQIIPVPLLGYKYISIHGFLNGVNDKVFIMATQNNTTVLVNGSNSLGNLNAGQTTFKASNGAPMYIEADKPISVFHISGFGCEVGGAILPPIECTGGRSVGITRSNTTDIYLNLLVPAGGEGGFTYNGNTTTITAAQFQSVPFTNNAWKYARENISSNLAVGNSAYITNTLKDFHLGVIHGNAGGGCRYGYFSDFKGFSASLSANSGICEGNNLQLNCNVPSSTGVTFAWTGPNGFTSSLQNPVINSATLAASGTYTCIATKANCSSSTNTIAITINPGTAFTLQTNAPLCVGANLQLNAQGASAGSTFAWTGPNGFTSALQNPTINNVTIANAGNYSVTVSNAGCTSTQIVNVAINPNPTATATNTGPYCEGNLLQLNATSNNANAVFSWTGPNGFTSALQNPSIASAQSIASGTYTVTVSGGGCANAIANTTVVVNPGPGATATGSTIICEGSTLQLNGSSPTTGVSFSWSGPNGFTSNLQNPTIANATPANSGTYTLSVTKNGCTTTATYTATVNVIPIANPTSNAPICANNVLQLNTASGNGFVYAWIGPNGFTSALQNPSIANATTANSGNYQVTVSSVGCANAVANINVVVNQSPNALASSNSPVCTQSDIALNTVNTLAGTAFLWTGPNAFTSTQQNNIITNATLNAQGKYYVEATLNGCTKKDSVQVIVRETPNAAIIQNSLGCRLQQLQLTNNNAVSGAVYSWSGPNGFTSNLQNIIISNYNYSDTGKYFLSVTANGCTAVDSIRATILESPQITFNPIAPVCKSAASFLLTATETSGISGVGIFSGNGVVSPNAFNPALANTSNNVVRYTYAASNGCVNFKEQTITVNPGPTVLAPIDQFIIKGSAITLTATTTTTPSLIIWTPTVGLSSTNTLTTIAKPDTTTLYKISVTDIAGCIGFDAVKVTVLGNVYIPTIFTPNGDGNNDRWVISGLDALPNCEVTVYSRFGDIVYQSKGYTNPWDGTNIGKNSPIGAYVFIVKLNDGIRNSIYKGTIILAR
jgi:gliding motility-associated-like protein